jgi:hypothetical protein
MMGRVRYKDVSPHFGSDDGQFAVVQMVTGFPKKQSPFKMLNRVTH